MRCSGAAIGYNACLGLVAGTAPLLSTYLVEITGNVLAPAWYLIALACVQRRFVAAPAAPEQLRVAHLFEGIQQPPLLDIARRTLVSST